MPQHMLFFHGVNTTDVLTGSYFNKAFDNVNDFTKRVKMHEKGTSSSEPTIQKEPAISETNVEPMSAPLLVPSQSRMSPVPSCSERCDTSTNDLDSSLLACTLCNYSSRIHYTMFLHMKKEHNVNDPKIITQLMRSVTDVPPESPVLNQNMMYVTSAHIEAQTSLTGYTKAIDLSPTKLKPVVTKIKLEVSGDSPTNPGYHLIDVTNLNTHFQSQQASMVQVKQQKTFPCKACNFRFDCESDLKIHQEFVDGITHPSGIMPCKPQTQTGYYFSEIPKFKAEPGITDHVKTQVNQLLARRRRLRRKPTRSKHPLGTKVDINKHGDPIYRCDCCDFSSPDKPTLDTHTLGEHGFVTDSKEFFCGYCGSQFNSRASLKVHVSVTHCSDDSNVDDPEEMSAASGTSQHRAESIDSQLSNGGGEEPGALVIDDCPDLTTERNHCKAWYCKFPGCDKIFKVAKHLKVNTNLY